MATCLGKCCSFGVLCVSFVNFYQIVCVSFLEGGMWDVIVLIPDHSLSVNF